LGKTLSPQATDLLFPRYARLLSRNFRLPVIRRFEELLMLINPKPRGGSAMRKDVWRAVIEVGFIIFLFYSNLLMGEFERSGMGRKRGLAWAIEDVFTAANLEIAMVAAFVGYILFEFLRKKF
jgi:hypothetical protein